MKNLKLQSLIASLFSVLFSISIVTAITGLNTLTYIVLYLFAVLFLLYNEDRKVTELRRKFRGKKSNIVTIIFTLIISVVMSSVGVFLWVNKDVSQHEKIQTNLSKEKFQIEKKYNTKIDSVNSLPNTSQYIDLQKELSWWKNRKPANLAERSNIRKNITYIQRKVDELYNTIKNDRLLIVTRLERQKQAESLFIESGNLVKAKNFEFNYLLSIVFLILVFITELVIVNIQREIARKTEENNNDEIRTVIDLLNQNLKSINVNDIKYHPFMENEEFRKCKKLFNLLENLGILTDVVKSKDFNRGDQKINIRGNFIDNKKEAIKRLRNYYIKFNNLKA